MSSKHTQRSLCIDTSSNKMTIALGLGNALAYEAYVEEGSSHCRELIPQIQQALEKMQWSVKDLDFMAVGLGPGSFTGLRVGVATAKAFAWNEGLDLVGFSSMMAMANRITDVEDVCVMQNARKHRVYAACYHRDATSWKVSVEEQDCDPIEFLEQFASPFPCLGDAKNNVVPLAEKKDLHLHWIHEDQPIKSLGTSIVELGHTLYNQQQLMNVYQASPNYARPNKSVATPGKVR
ncbi:MAG: tRNA (adenosine(37)-N6)-threonylcarbamoyltransferase complex dimerization subunit type 1 TsaB [Bdellovibrionota bacterium]